MSPEKLSQDVFIAQTQRDINTMEKALERISNVELPEIYRRLNKLDVKVTSALVLWGFNIAILVFIVNRLFDISAKLR